MFNVLVFFAQNICSLFHKLLMNYYYFFNMVDRRPTKNKMIHIIHIHIQHLICSGDRKWLIPEMDTNTWAWLENKYTAVWTDQNTKHRVEFFFYQKTNTVFCILKILNKCKIGHSNEQFITIRLTFIQT